jgi:hypothetical protein
MNKLFKKENVSFKNCFIKINRKDFFLKYLQRKNLIKEENTKQQSIDLKDLLDENKIKLTFADILRDWRYFRNAYYFKEVEEKPDEPKKLPFEKKDMKAVDFFREFFNREMKLYVFLLLIIYSVAIYLTYRVSNVERKNIERLEFLHQTNQDNLAEEKLVYKKIKL